MNAHVPSTPPVALRLHDWQSVLLLPPHAVSQHRLSTQNPVEHWPSFEHGCPVPELVAIVRLCTRTVCRSGRDRVYAMRVTFDDASDSSGSSSSSGSVDTANAAPLSAPLVPTCWPKMSVPVVLMLRPSVHATRKLPDSDDTAGRLWMPAAAPLIEKPLASSTLSAEPTVMRAPKM